MSSPSRKNEIFQGLCNSLISFRPVADTVKDLAYLKKESLEGQFYK